MTLQKLIEKFKSYESCDEYISASGKKCYCIGGNLDYYFLLCGKIGINSHWVDDFRHEAQGDGFMLEYVEHDIILAIDPTMRENCTKINKGDKTQ